jgi:hypothetical protein
MVLVGNSADTTKGRTLATKKVTAKAEPTKGTFTMITKSPKTWGARIAGSGEKGQTVVLINRYGGQYQKKLVQLVATVPANEFTGQPAGEVWTFA